MMVVINQAGKDQAEPNSTCSKQISKAFCGGCPTNRYPGSDPGVEIKDEN